MAVIPDFKSATLIDFLKQNVEAGSTVYTDGLKSFTGLPEAGFQQVPRSQPLRVEWRQGAKSAVPLADRAIGNLQQWLIGTYHSVSRDQLQVYLDEFAFRHNRRRQPMAAFQTLLGLGTGRKPTPYKQIRGAVDLSFLIAPQRKALPPPLLLFTNTSASFTSLRSSSYSAEVYVEPEPSGSKLPALKPITRIITSELRRFSKAVSRGVPGDAKKSSIDMRLRQVPFPSAPGWLWLPLPDS
jgi:transposase-like protein